MEKISGSEHKHEDADSCRSPGLPQTLPQPSPPHRLLKREPGTSPGCPTRDPGHGCTRPDRPAPAQAAALTPP